MKCAIFVHLDDKRVGTILSVLEKNRFFYRYHPLHDDNPGALFPTIQAVKDDIEENHYPLAA